MAWTSVCICLTALACLLYSMKEVTQLHSQLLLNGCSEVRRTLLFTLAPFSQHFWGAVYKNWGSVSTNQLIPALLPDLSKFNLWPGRPILTLGQLWGGSWLPLRSPWEHSRSGCLARMGVRALTSNMSRVTLDLLCYPALAPTGKPPATNRLEELLFRHLHNHPIIICHLQTFSDNHNHP